MGQVGEGNSCLLVPRWVEGGVGGGGEEQSQKGVDNRFLPCSPAALPSALLSQSSQLPVCTAPPVISLVPHLCLASGCSFSELT